MAGLNFFSDAANLAKVNEYITVKQPPKVVKQTPAPGTPVVTGMTIEVEVVSFSDVPLEVVVPDAPIAVRKVPLADLDKLVSEDASVRTAVEAGTVAPADRGLIAEKLNAALRGRGLSGTVTADDADAIVKSIGTIRGVGR